MAAVSYRLIMKDLKDVLEAVVLMGGKKWKRLGIQLEVKYERLEKIQRSNPTVDDCLLEVLKEWLRRTIDPAPTWEWLAEAMASKTVDEPGLAQEIYRDWIKPMQPKFRPKNRKLGRRKPRRLSPKPIKPVRPRRNRRPRPEKMAYLNHLPPPSPPLTSEADPLGPQSPSVPHWWGRHFSNQPHTFPHFSSATLSQEERLSLERRLLVESSDVQSAFQWLVGETASSFKRRITPNHLANVLMQFQDSLTGQAGLKVSIACESYLRSASSIVTAFDILLGYFSCFNYELLAVLIQLYGSETDEENLARYIEIISEFTRRRLCECPIEAYGTCNEDDMLIQIKLAYVFDFYTLRDVSLFRSKLSRTFQLASHALRFIGLSRSAAGSGCLELVFVLPSSLGGVLQRLTKEELGELEREGVLELESKPFRYNFRKVLKINKQVQSVDLSFVPKKGVAKQPPKAEFYRVELEGVVWNVPVHYQQLREPSGDTCSAVDVRSGHRVALRKLPRPFHSPLQSRGTYRELLHLSSLTHHHNIASLLDAFTPATDLKDFHELYFAAPHLGSDLSRVCSSKQPLTDEQIQLIVSQILSGLKYAHSAGIVHGSLQPSSIAINDEDLTLQIHGFGQSRLCYECQEPPALQWAAPDLLLDWRQWGTPVDVWSVGCIMAELLTGAALFPGRSRIDQLAVIVQTLGSPSQTFLNSLPSQPARSFLAGMHKYDGVAFSRQFPGASEGAVDLLTRLLVVEPDHRLTAGEGLAHPYLATHFDPRDEVPAAVVSQEFERIETSTEEWKKLVYTAAVESFVPDHNS